MIAEEPAMAVDPRQFRSVMGRFATGVTVVTTCQGGERLGITVNAFCSVSLDPPLVLVCIERTSRVQDVQLQSGVFADNFLSKQQDRLSTCFAGNSERRYRDFCGATSHSAATGAPILDGCIGYVDCRIVESYSGGDLSIVVGWVEALGQSEGEPLLYYRSRYHHPHENTR